MMKSKSLLILSIFSSMIIVIGLYLTLSSKKTSVVLSVAPPSLPPVAQVSNVESQVSPDGTHVVSLKSNTSNTEIFVNDSQISNIPVEEIQELLIPFNTWSPDNKYLFINEKKMDKSEFLVFSKTGKQFADQSHYLKVSELFGKAHPESTIVDVTGWAAPYLLIINAKSANEAKMTFWFEVTTSKFIRLSNYFY